MTRVPAPTRLGRRTLRGRPVVRSRAECECLLCLAFALFAAITMVTGLLPQRVWAKWALVGFIGAALVLAHRCWSGKGHGLGAVPLAILTTVCLGCPLVSMAWSGLALDEVTVTAQAAQRLISGTPLYPMGAELTRATAEQGFDTYFPYLPAMALLGVPGVLAKQVGLGPVLGDPRIIFTWLYLAEIACVARWAHADWKLLWLLLVASPLAALPLSTGGDDLPIIGALLLSLALSRADHPTAAGLVIGCACSAKLTAWPVLAVLAVMWFKWRSRRQALVLVGTATSTMAVFMAPFLVSSAQGLIAHTVGFPLGFAHVASPAAAPFLGRLVAEHVPNGRIIATGVILLAAAVLGVVLVIRTPRTEARVAVFCAVGLATAAILMPSSRGGYIIYPLALLVGAHALAHQTDRTDAPPSAPSHVDSLRHTPGQRHRPFFSARQVLVEARGKSLCRREASPFL